MKIFVFDDTDPEQTSYLGIADIPLIPLAHDKGVAGIFELKGAEGRINGTVEVELRWQFTYMSPQIVKTMRTQQVRKRQSQQKSSASQTEASMANSVDPDQTAPIGAVCSGSMLFSSTLNSSVMLGNYLQQTTSADDIFRCIFIPARKLCL